jgi:hypothetical protein
LDILSEGDVFAQASVRVEKSIAASAFPVLESVIANLALVALSLSLLFQLGSPPQNFSSLHESPLETHSSHGLRNFE